MMCHVCERMCERERETETERNLLTMFDARTLIVWLM